MALGLHGRASDWNPPFHLTCASIVPEHRARCRRDADRGPRSAWARATSPKGSISAAIVGRAGGKLPQARIVDAAIDHSWRVSARRRSAAFNETWHSPPMLAPLALSHPPQPSTRGLSARAFVSGSRAALPVVLLASGGTSAPLASRARSARLPGSFACSGIAAHTGRAAAGLPPAPHSHRPGSFAWCALLDGGAQFMSVRVSVGGLHCSAHSVFPGAASWGAHRSLMWMGGARSRPISRTRASPAMAALACEARWGSRGRNAD